MLSALSLNYKVLKAEIIFHFHRLLCHFIALYKYWCTFLNTINNFACHNVHLSNKECLKVYDFYVAGTVHILKWYFFRMPCTGITEVTNLVSKFVLTATLVMHILHMKISLVLLLGRTKGKTES